jgi:hypothetical protein
MAAPSPAESDAVHQAVSDELWRLTLIRGEIAQRVERRRTEEQAGNTDDLSGDAERGAG